MFTQLQSLPLVVAFDIAAVHHIGNLAVRLEYHAAERLAVLDQKRYIV